MILLGSAPARAQDVPDDLEEPDPAVLQADARWSGNAAEGFVLEADVSSALSWAVRVEARLGALGTTWTQSGLSPDASGTLRVALDPPAAAHLHALADDYVTDLRVTLRGTDGQGRLTQAITAPPAFLAWPSGASGSPVVWDLPTMRVEAPAGVVDAQLRADLGDLSGIDRVGPPLERSTPIPYDDQAGD